jgi:hypothetical protein
MTIIRFLSSPACRQAGPLMTIITFQEMQDILYEAGGLAEVVD